MTYQHSISVLLLSSSALPLRYEGALDLGLVSLVKGLVQKEWRAALEVCSAYPAV